MIKRVAIITWYRNCYNYGGILQAYALQKALELEGYDSKQIAYFRAKRKFFDLVRIFGNYGFSWLFKGIRDVFKLSGLHKEQSGYFIERKKLFDDFIESIPHTSQCDDTNVCEINNEFDAFVCGSDQIWNPLVPDSNMFLNFASNNKIKMAYAVSLGTGALKSNELKYITKYAADLNAIGVREYRTKELLQDVLQREVQVVLDPTMLLEKEEWKKLIEDETIIVNEPYIFAYFLGKSNDYDETITTWARKYGLKILYPPYLSADGIDEAHDGWVSISGVGPKQFLSLIYHATYVITDSFHGTVFSILFEKSYVSLMRFKSNDKHSMNSRMETLLKLTRQSERMQGFNELDMDVLFKTDDYQKINEEIEKSREESLRFIRDVLG